MSTEQRPTPLRLAAIVPHTIVRRGMEAVFDATPEVDLIQMGIDAGDLEAFTPVNFDVVLVVVTMQSGYDDVRTLVEAGHRVVTMGSPEHKGHALAAGAASFVSGEVEPDVLIWALLHPDSGAKAAPAEPMEPVIRVAIVVSDPDGQKHLPQIFEGTRCQVVASVADPQGLEDATRFDVVILGVGPRNPDVPARMQAARRFYCPILCFGTTEYMEVAQAIGIQGFMRGAETPDEIIRAVEAVRDGGTYYPESRASLASMLSTREREVIEHLARGCTDREIGDRLGISMRTVQSHLDRIREKTGRRRRAELTRLAMELGVTAVGD